MIVLFGILLLLLATMGVVLIVVFTLLREAREELVTLRPIAPAPVDPGRAAVLDALDRPGRG